MRIPDCAEVVRHLPGFPDYITLDCFNFNFRAQTMTQPLSQQKKKSLRAKAHDLKPVILMGNKGLSPAVLAEADRALDDHELIKVRLNDDDRDVRKQSCTDMCQHLKAEMIQSIGKIAVLYRQKPEEPSKATSPQKPKQKAKAKAKR